MEIGKINNKMASNIDAAKSKAADGDFEARLNDAMSKNDDQELRKACKDFEGIILGMMYKQMKATVPKSDLIPADSGREIFESMLDDKFVELASQNNGLGLGENLYKQLSRQLKSTYKL